LGKYHGLLAIYRRMDGRCFFSRDRSMNMGTDQKMVECVSITEAARGNPMPTDLIHFTMAFTFVTLWAVIGHIAVVRRRL
jgi:hypothetical protein